MGLLVLTSACSDDAGRIAWTVDFAEAFDRDAVQQVRLEVRRGGCEANELLYAAEVGRDEPTQMPPRIADQEVVSIIAVAIDGECMAVGRACEQVRWPPDGDIRQQIVSQEARPCSECLCGGGMDASLPDVMDIPCHVFGPPRLLPGLNTEEFEASAWIPDDLLTVYFARASDEFEPADLYRATRTSIGEAFSQTTAIQDLNTRFSENYPFVFDDERQIVFSRGGDFALGMRASVSDAFEVGGLGVDGGADDASFVMTGDRLEGYFSSTRVGGEGGNDLYLVRRASVDAAWSEPEILPFVNNSDERYPGISADGQTLVYQIANKLLLSERAGRTLEFERGQAIFEPPLGKSDQRPALSPDGLKLVFSSDRGGSSFDLWISERSCRVAL